jgi:hypothetical protein
MERTLSPPRGMLLLALALLHLAALLMWRPVPRFAAYGELRREGELVILLPPSPRRLAPDGPFA